MAKVPKALSESVRVRARNTCEYCLMPQEFERAPFQIEHIVADQHRGLTELSNLALACLRCNKRKGPNLSGRDPKTGKKAWLFNPRVQKWSRHFRWEGAVSCRSYPDWPSDCRDPCHHSPIRRGSSAYPQGGRSISSTEIELEG